VQQRLNTVEHGEPRLLEHNDPEFLAPVVEWLDTPDPATQLALHSQAAEVALTPVGAVWPAGMFPLGAGIWERPAGDAP
jgi:hypothetical protein